MKKLLIALLLAPALTITSCASIVKPRGKVNIPVRVNMEGYTVFLNGIDMGEARFITVQKDDVVTVEKDGHQKSVTQVQGKFNGWVIGNLVSGGLIGVAIDGLTGNLNEVTTNSINVTLKPKQ